MRREFIASESICRVIGFEKRLFRVEIVDRISRRIPLTAANVPEKEASIILSNGNREFFMRTTLIDEIAAVRSGRES